MQIQKWCPVYPVSLRCQSSNAYWPRRSPRSSCSRVCVFNCVSLWWCVCVRVAFAVRVYWTCPRLLWQLMACECVRAIGARTRAANTYTHTHVPTAGIQHKWNLMEDNQQQRQWHGVENAILPQCAVYIVCLFLFGPPRGFICVRIGKTRL